MYGADLKTFLCAFNPDSQAALSAAPTEAVMADTPTLATIRAAYGDNAPIAWLVPQIWRVIESSGLSTKANEAQIADVSRMIIANYYYLKVSELMCFFGRFKLGMYGRFYAVIDNILFLESLGKFVKERNILIDKAEAEARKKQRETEVNLTRAEYLALKQQTV